MVTRLINAYVQTREDLYNQCIGFEGKLARVSGRIALINPTEAVMAGWIKIGQVGCTI